MNDDKTLVDSVRALRDANISRNPNSEHNEEEIGGVPTRLHNSRLTSEDCDDAKSYASEHIEGMKQAFQELRDEEDSGRSHYVW